MRCQRPAEYAAATGGYRQRAHSHEQAIRAMLHETVFMEWRDSTMLSRFRRPVLCALLALALPATSAWAAAPRR
jgi:hypothetical protein